MKKLLKPALGLALLAGLLSSLDRGLLGEVLGGAHLGWFALGCLLALMANLICVTRWQRIAQGLHLPLQWPQALSLYAQAITANSVLPGGIVGGDLWRVIGLSRLASTGHKTSAAASVLADRVSGLWGLAWVSLLASGYAWFSLETGWLHSELGALYLAGLISILVLPYAATRLARVGRARFVELSVATPMLRRTLALSIAVQLLTSLAFWCCMQAVNLPVPLALIVALSGGIFIVGILPATIGGFGARELGALALITPFGFSKELVMASSILFGLTVTVQGLLGLYFWLRDHSRMT
ncbi:hypothetical protein GH816_03195 [Betaproteobacteria bacterium LSUCC0115]|nr:hypothetical protein [Burkholderiales bacterium LSUCC0115]